MKLRNEDLIEYIKIQWADIHHSRNQEWKAIAIIIGIFYAIFKIDIQHINLHIAIAILGLIACGMGVYISLMHWFIFYNKIQIIRACEEKLGICPKFYRAFLPVQGLMVLLHLFIASILGGWLVWLFSKNMQFSFLAFSVLFGLSISGCFFAKSKVQKTIEKLDINIEGSDQAEKQISFPDFPLIAELNDLTDCLFHMGERPLKLIAGKIFSNESEWDVAKWSFKVEDKAVIDKKLLLNPADKFEFSVANENSRQDFHVHKDLFEIYISHSRIDITYLEKGNKKNLSLSKGVLIVPPGVPHQVKLYGLTFVFQTVQNEGKVETDKEIVVA